MKITERVTCSEYKNVDLKLIIDTRNINGIKNIAKRKLLQIICSYVTTQIKLKAQVGRMGLDYCRCLYTLEFE